MSLEIDLHGDEFILILPTSGRKLAVPATALGIEYLKKIITDAKHPKGKLGQSKGYCRDYPTQHVIEQWMKEDAKRKEEENREAIEEKYNVKLSKLNITL